MRSYLRLIGISAKVRKRQNRMTLMCIVIAVFLVTTVFSMVGMMLDMEKTELIQSHGHWHIALLGLSEDVVPQIASRSDVRTIARWETLGEEASEHYSLGTQKAAVYGAEEAWITDIYDCLEEGAYPQSRTEVIASPNAKNTLGVKLGDRITLDTPAGSMDYTISGFGAHDPEFNAMSDTITLYMDEAAFSELCRANSAASIPTYSVRFATDRSITRRIHALQRDYGIPDDAIEENTALLSITGYSSNGYARALYPLAFCLFVLILLAGVFMISSSMNSNVAQRTQFFGVMRCIGMSRRQILGYVRLEALNWCKTAIPIGIALGIVSTWGLCFWLKYGIQGEFSGLPLFHVNIAGMALGAAVGILSVLIAASSPAKRAAKVTPIAAVSGNTASAEKALRTRLPGFVGMDTALGIHHAMSARKNRILMTGSFALSIILFLGFSAGLAFAKALLPSTRDWQPDFSILSEDETNSVDRHLAAELQKLEGVENVYGNQIAMALPAASEKDIREITLVSYDEYMLQCAEENRVSGDFSKLSGGRNFVLTIYDPRNPLEEGDKIQVNGAVLEVAGIVSEGLFEDDITLICTEEVFERLMGESDYALLNIQITDHAGKEEMVASIRSLLKDSYALADYYDINKENTAEFWGFRIVVYGFLFVLVWMAALNIINSTSMSVSARIKQYGVMRAVGMSGRQLTKMIAAEVFTYAVFGCGIGCALGLIFHKMIYEAFITAYFGEIWRVPKGETAIILLLILASSLAAVYAPAKRIRHIAITETINEL